jgi:hypothetical protein
MILRDTGGLVVNDPELAELLHLALMPRPASVSIALSPDF